MNGTGKPAVHPAGRPAKLPGGLVRHRTVAARQGEHHPRVVVGQLSEYRSKEPGRTSDVSQADPHKLLHAGTRRGSGETLPLSLFTLGAGVSSWPIRLSLCLKLQ